MSGPRDGPAGSTCRGTRDDGEPCRSPFVVEDGFCPAHAPGGREEQRRRGSIGGEVTRRRYRSMEKLTDADLPPLEGREDARAWLRVTARAVATGRLSAREGEVLRETVREFLRALDGEDAAGPDLLDRYLRDRYGDGNG